MKHLIIALLLTLLAGCSGHSKEQDDLYNKEVEAVVASYLENAVAGNWEVAFGVLSGEALAEAKANSGRVKHSGKIINRIFSTRSVCRNVREVSCDVTKSDGGRFDRQAYTFRLKDSGGWFIYKVEYGDYLHADLEAGDLPAGAGQLIKKYIEMAYTEKRAFDYLYLAGRLLQESQKAVLLPVDIETASDRQKVITIVKSMECLGRTQDYAVVSVSCDVLRNGRAYSIEALVDVLQVNGKWRICRMDVSRLST